MASSKDLVAWCNVFQRSAVKSIFEANRPLSIPPAPITKQLGCTSIPPPSPLQNKLKQSRNCRIRITWLFVCKDAVNFSNFYSSLGRVPVGGYRRTTWSFCRNLVYNFSRIPWPAMAPYSTKKEDNAQPSNDLRCNRVMRSRRKILRR